MREVRRDFSDKRRLGEWVIAISNPFSHCGAPCTVASYMIAGIGTAAQEPARRFAYEVVACWFFRKSGARRRGAI